MLHLITTERQVQLRGGTPVSICAYAQLPPRQRLSSNCVLGSCDEHVTLGDDRHATVINPSSPGLPQE